VGQAFSLSLSENGKSTDAANGRMSLSSGPRLESAVRAIAFDVIEFAIILLDSGAPGKSY
jgi:hypothetical protein